MYSGIHICSQTHELKLLGHQFYPCLHQYLGLSVLFIKLQCQLWMLLNSSVQKNLFIHLRVHPVMFLLDRHSERVNHLLICFCCVFQFVKTIVPNYLAAKIQCNHPLYVYPHLLNTTPLYNPGASAILNICRNSEDECTWLLPCYLSQHFPHKNNLIISVVFGGILSSSS